MSGGRVLLVSHDPTWGEVYEQEAARLREALGDLHGELHHIGSTAIQGIAAKPIVDMLGVVVDIERVGERRVALEALGYEWRGEFGIPGRRFLTLPDLDWPLERRIHLHLYESRHHEVPRHLGFRDLLRAEPETAAEYERVKLALARRFPDRRDGYTAGKSEFIEAAIARALG